MRSPKRSGPSHQYSAAGSTDGSKLVTRLCRSPCHKRRGHPPPIPPMVSLSIVASSRSCRLAAATGRAGPRARRTARRPVGVRGAGRPAVARRHPGRHQSARKITIGKALAVVPRIDRPNVRSRPAEHVHLGGDNPGPRCIQFQPHLHRGGNLQRGARISRWRMGDRRNHDGQRPANPPRGKDHGAGPILGAFLAALRFLRSPQIGIPNDKTRLRVRDVHRVVTPPARGRISW